MTEMSKIHPKESKSEAGGHAATSGHTATEWTVWKRSSMAFEGSDGFSVYDSEGRLAFRVDNYSRQHKCLSGELLLMDGAGRALLALRPQILSMHDRWIGLKSKEGSKTGSQSHVFMMRRRSILQHGDEAEVFMGESTTPDFWTEGCFRIRHCNIRGSTGEEVAQISRKKASSSVMLGDDVFSLVIQPGVDCQLMMAFVVVMDRICQKHFYCGADFHA